LHNFGSLSFDSISVIMTMCVHAAPMWRVLTGCVIAGEMGSTAGGQVTAEEGLSASASAVLPGGPRRSAVAADVVPGESYPARWLIALLMEAANSSETSVNFYQTTRRYNPEDSHLRTHRRENLKS
jgi:hypothetical protein